MNILKSDIVKVVAKSAQNAETKENSDKRKSKYLSFSTNNINYGLDDFISEEEQRILSEIVWKIFDKGCELKIGYLYNNKISED